MLKKEDVRGDIYNSNLYFWKLLKINVSN
jgi:hypothetical protein